jgi:hypothetical protein
VAVPVAVAVSPNNLARGVDAICHRPRGAQGIVEGGVVIGRHVTVTFVDAAVTLERELFPLRAPSSECG